MFWLLAAKAASAAKSSSSVYIPVFVAIIGLVSAWGGYLLKWYLDQRKEKKEHARKNVMGRYFELTSGIYTLINAALQQLGAKRILILRAEDGGGVPKPGSQVYTSVIWESYDPPIKSIAREWQRHRVDEQYMKMLSNVYHDEFVHLRTEDIDNGLLRDIYRSSGINAVHLQQLHTNESRFIYMSIAYTETIDFDEPNRRMCTDILANQLRIKLEEMAQLEEEAK